MLPGLISSQLGMPLCSMISMYNIIGADYRAQDTSGKYAFDYISDHKEWIDSGHFGDEVKARLKGENLIANYTTLIYNIII